CWIRNKLGPVVDKKLCVHKREMFSHAHGKVLDVGSGVGPTFKFLDEERDKPITEVVAIEPNPFMLDRLKEAARDHPYKVKVLNSTIAEALQNGELKNGTFDTVICNLVLCSIPNYQGILVEIQQLLRPGGKLLFIEHIVSENPIASTIQNVLNPFWGMIGDGCNLTRETSKTITRMSGWKSVDISIIPEAHYISLTHVKG
ncbi:hypothetical protein SAMD00019534_062350, partial [Acytostelium subglobosum LB1]|uniref:hypothetical protein n=1 Tax=Acytostelium subglobosum LB1 TaxID=1410327 RepID=UPI000644C4C9